MPFLNFFDFVALARAFGSQGFRVEAAHEPIPALNEALASPAPSLVDVPVDYRENFKLTERMGQLVCRYETSGGKGH